MRETLDDILSRWGAWHARRHDFQGYPTRSVFAALTDPHYFNPQHKILCLDRPGWIGEIDRHVSKIPKPYRDALHARYAWPPVDGRLMSERELARVLHISRSCYRQRLYRARRALLSLVGIA